MIAGESLLKNCRFIMISMPWTKDAASAINPVHRNHAQAAFE
jgi:hypothetical protein